MPQTLCICGAITGLNEGTLHPRARVLFVAIGRAIARGRKPVVRPHSFGESGSCVHQPAFLSILFGSLLGQRECAVIQRQKTETPQISHEMES
jgi:hypothetical protein